MISILTKTALALSLASPISALADDDLSNATNEEVVVLDANSENVAAARKEAVADGENGAISNADATVLDEIVVTDTAGGGAFIDQNKLRNLATPTNSITDSLRSRSNIQFFQGSRSSAQGGEIAPPQISIAGGRHYENNFMLSGISNNNNINPLGLGTSNEARSGGKSASVTGESQSFFIDTSLVDSVAVYTENISAEYGSFTGGVVDAKLRDARDDRWHIMAKYRYTKASWAEFYPNDTQEDIEYARSRDNYQPEFNKYEFNAALDGPVGDHVGAIFSYAKQHSKVPLWSEYFINSGDKERQTQYRVSENFMARLNTKDIDSFDSSLTFIYAPYTEYLFQPRPRYGDYDNKGGGLSVAYDMKNHLGAGLLKTAFSYQETELSREAETNYYFYNLKKGVGGMDWSTSATGATGNMGAFGAVEQTKRSFIFKETIDFDDIATGFVTHEVKAGLDAELGKAHYKSSGSTTYGQAGGVETNLSAVGGIENGVAYGQWAKQKVVNLPQDNEVGYANAAIFLEDAAHIDRFTIRPGVRVSTDTLTNNIDVAPRLFANADIFNDDALNVFGGYNRYYGAQILAYAIMRDSSVTYSRAAWNAAWNQTATSETRYGLGDLRTPHSDEFNIGASFKHGDAIFGLSYLDRRHKDQIRAKTETVSGVTNREHTNEGKTHYWGATASAAIKYDLGATKHVSELSATKSDTTTNMRGPSGFSDADGATVSLTHATLDGSRVAIDDLPATHFNSPWVITYSHTIEAFKDLHIGALARYEKGGSGLKTAPTGTTPIHTGDDGLPATIYYTKDYRDTFVVDLSVGYDIKIGDHTFALGLEVLNLFNRKNEVTSQSSGTSVSDEYSMGRQYYANVRYEF
ncbi:MAG: TonB-dependent receptor plug domain-containing protein [Helicobacteraceae bacterium]|jgi:hypothetical protein|nr:TonB-dependent receptor plug domain-containing protein [Helicobacteraceae bacterium]